MSSAILLQIKHIYGCTHAVNKGWHGCGCVCVCVHVFVCTSICKCGFEALLVHERVFVWAYPDPDAPDVFEGQRASCGLWFWAHEDEDERDTHLYTTQRGMPYSPPRDETRGLGKWLIKESQRTNDKRLIIPEEIWDVLMENNEWLVWQQHEIKRMCVTGTFCI